MPISEKEKAATNLSIKLKNDLPANIEFSWDDNYTLTFATNEKPVLIIFYADYLPNESDSRDLVATVKSIIRQRAV
jgi:hypothetical protein